MVRNQEEEEESFEVESEEEPAPVGKAASPRERHTKRDRSNPPLPANLLSREASRLSLLVNSVQLVILTHV